MKNGRKLRECAHYVRLRFPIRKKIIFSSIFLWTIFFNSVSSEPKIVILYEFSSFVHSKKFFAAPKILELQLFVLVFILFSRKKIRLPTAKKFAHTSNVLGFIFCVVLHIRNRTSVWICTDFHRLDVFLMFFVAEKNSCTCFCTDFHLSCRFCTYATCIYFYNCICFYVYIGFAHMCKCVLFFILNMRMCVCVLFLFT